MMSVMNGTDVLLNDHPNAFTFIIMPENLA
jgi:hypothetical protein